LPLGNHLRIWDTFFCVGKNTEQGIVRESRKVIWKILQQIYITVTTLEEWLRIADEFNEICKIA